MPSSPERERRKEQLLAGAFWLALFPAVPALIALLRATHDRVFVSARGRGPASGQTLTIFDLSRPRGRVGRWIGDQVSSSGLQSLPMLISIAVGNADLGTARREANHLRKRQQFDVLREKRYRLVHEGSFDAGSDELDARLGKIDEKLWRLFYGADPMPPRHELQEKIVTREYERVETEVKPGQRPAWADLSEYLSVDQMLQLGWATKTGQSSLATPVCSRITADDQSAGDDYYNEILPMPAKGGGLRLEIRRRSNVGHSAPHGQHRGRDRIANRRTGSRGRASRGCAVRTTGSRRTTASRAGPDDDSGESDPADGGDLSLWQHPEYGPVNPALYRFLLAADRGRAS